MKITNIYLIIGSIAIITDVLNIGVLYRRAILISPCPYSFLSFIVSSLVYICIRCSTQFLRIYYPDDSLFSDNFCTIEVFTIYLLPAHATFILTLASIDRFFLQVHLVSHIVI